jgi:Flp pilus assembly protein TadG
MKRRLRNLWKNDRGVAAVEAALLLPVLLTTFIGCTEVTFKIWSTQKAEKLAVTIADVVTQSQTISAEGLEQVVSASDRIMEPFTFGTANGEIFISSIYVPQDETVAKVNWQCKVEGALESASKLGETGDDAVLPEGLVLAERDNVIVAEIFFKYTPIMPGLMFDETVVYRRAFFKPRLGALTNSPGNPCSLTV